MTWRQRLLAWFAFVLLAFLAIYELRAVLLPFVLGMAVAYMLDPVVGRLERSIGRATAAVLALAWFFLLVFGSLLLIVPVIEQQVEGLPKVLPGLLDRARTFVTPFLESALHRFQGADGANLPELSGANISAAAGAAMGALGGLVTGGLVLFDVLSVLIITPIVSFYLLRDWDRMIATIDDWLPRADAETVREQARAIDQTLAAFVRGQALVCLALGLWYAAGLTLIGLDFGVLIGLFIGVIAFIPILGSLIGAILSVGLSLIQFGTWQHALIVVALFAVGQFAEAYILAPRLIGDRVGLHPVWVIFALLAGGALGGLLGVLLAVPIAAVVGVLARFALTRYLQSPLYRAPALPPEEE